MPPNTTGTNKGTISAQNVGAPNGNAVTANSTVIAQLGGGFDTASIQVVGTYTGALTVQVQNDGGTWVTVSAATALTNAATKVQSATIASAAQGVWYINVSGVNAVRVTALAAVTGSAVVTIIGGTGTGAVTVDNPITFAASQVVTAYPTTGSALSVVTTASTNASAPKTSAGNLFEVTVSNPTATPIYVKFYNKASAPTVGTDVPVLTLAVPATAAGVGEKTYNFGAIGKRFTTGIAMAATAAAAATDTGVAVAGVQIHGTYI